MCESLGKKAAGAMHSGLAGLYLKSALVGKLSTVSRNWLSLGRAEPPGSARPKMAKHQSTENKRQG